MARYTGPRCKICRREGMKLFLKGQKCESPACAFAKRPYAPGEQGKKVSRKKPTYYAMQLREKQKVKRVYGTLERQFKRYFKLAAKSKGVTGRTMLQLLERRLDNVTFRLLFASSRSQARQLVKHNFIFVNGQRVNVPSYLIKANDKIQLKAKEDMTRSVTKGIEEISKQRSVASWLFLDKGNLKGEVLKLPEKEDLSIPISEQLIVELYSK